MNSPFLSLGSIETLEDNDFVGIAMDDRRGRDNDVWCVSEFTLDNFRAFPAMFFNHDPDRIVAVAVAIGPINSHEIGIRGRLLPDASADAAEAAALVRAGALKGLSAGIDPQQVEPLGDGSGGLRVVQADLLEVSLVPIPASVDAKIIAARSLSAASRARLARSLPRISERSIERALAGIGRSQRQEGSRLPGCEPWEIVARERARMVQHCRTVSALQVSEREREHDYSREQRRADLLRLSPRGTGN